MASVLLSSRLALMGSRGPKPGDLGYRAPADLRERLLSKITIDASGCWLWPSRKDRKGYGGITVGSRIDGSMTSRRVHIVAHEVFVGPIPKGLTIDHICEVKLCINPAHLELVTNAENKRRGGDRMTHCRRGHVRNALNTYVRKDGHRQCRVCKRELAKPGPSARAGSGLDE